MAKYTFQYRSFKVELEGDNEGWSWTVKRLDNSVLESSEGFMYDDREIAIHEAKSCIDDWWNEQ